MNVDNAYSKTVLDWTGSKWTHFDNFLRSLPLAFTCSVQKQTKENAVLPKKILKGGCAP